MQRIVKITKLRAADDPDIVTPKWDKYIPGQDNGFVSLPVDYTLKGVEQSAPQKDKIYYIARTERNGEKVDGEFRSSTVQKIHPNDENGNLVFETLNSVYVVEYLPAVWKSFAKWPHPEVNLWTEENVSEDSHGSKAGAVAVANMLVEKGFGGDGVIFPIRTWTELVEVKPKADEINEVLKEQGIGN